MLVAVGGTASFRFGMCIHYEGNDFSGGHNFDLFSQLPGFITMLIVKYCNLYRTSFAYVCTPAS